MRYLSAHYVFPVSSPPLKNGIVCTDDHGMIVDVIDTGGKLQEREKLEFYNGILVPGFVNTHCHLELSHLRGVMKSGCGLPDFLSSVGRIRPADEHTVCSAAKAAEDEMLRNGIVAVGDISNRTDTVPIKQAGRLRYRTFVEVFGLDDRQAESLFFDALNLKRIYRDAGLHVSVVPHAPYSVSTALFEMLGNEYVEHPSIVSMHHQESEEETTLYPEGKGALAEIFRKNGLLPKEISRRHLVDETEQCLSFAQQTLLVHNTFTSERDILQRTARLKNVFWALCPASNLYIQNRLPDLLLFADDRLNVCIGTDSLASNTGLSILEEIKIIGQHAPDISLSKVLSLATLNGAKALGFDDILGSFEKGKTPGINLITNIDFDRMQLSEKSTVEVLV